MLEDGEDFRSGLGSLRCCSGVALEVRGFACAASGLLCFAEGAFGVLSFVGMVFGTLRSCGKALGICDLVKLERAMSGDASMRVVDLSGGGSERLGFSGSGGACCFDNSPLKGFSPDQN